LLAQADLNEKIFLKLLERFLQKVLLNTESFLYRPDLFLSDLHKTQSTNQIYLFAIYANGNYNQACGPFRSPFTKATSVSGIVVLTNHGSFA